MLRSSWLRRFDRRRAIKELPLASLPMNEDNLALTEAIIRLPQKHKDIILLHYYQGLSLRASAQILNISASTATRHLAQATKRLKTEFERG